MRRGGFGRRLPTMRVEHGSGVGGAAWAIDIECQRCERRQSIEHHGQVTRETVMCLAAIIDGTAFPSPPGPESPLCKCGICSGELRTRVRDLRGAAQAS